MRPSLVAPVVAWLCHEDCQDNGSVIEAAGGWAGKCEWLDFGIQMKFYFQAICRRYSIPTVLLAQLKHVIQEPISLLPRAIPFPPFNPHSSCKFMPCRRKVGPPISRFAPSLPSPLAHSFLHPQIASSAAGETFCSTHLKEREKVPQRYCHFCLDSGRGTG